MNTNAPYQTHVEYRFKVAGYCIAIIEIGNGVLCVEDTRKNGQEDSHMIGWLVLVDGKWKWSAETLESYFGNPFEFYGSKELADGIVAFINEHGLPK